MIAKNNSVHKPTLHTFFLMEKMFLGGLYTELLYAIIPNSFPTFSVAIPTSCYMLEV